MIIKMCKNCYSTIQLHLSEANKIKKCEKCGGKLFEVDDYMVEPLQLLHAKGYTTQYCCSGHCNYSDIALQTYIMLDGSLKDNGLKEIEDGRFMVYDETNAAPDTDNFKLKMCTIIESVLLYVNLPQMSYVLSNIDKIYVISENMDRITDYIDSIGFKPELSIKDSRDALIYNLTNVIDVYNDFRSNTNLNIVTNENGTVIVTCKDKKIIEITPILIHCGGYYEVMVFYENIYWYN